MSNDRTARQGPAERPGGDELARIMRRANDITGRRGRGEEVGVGELLDYLRAKAVYLAATAERDPHPETHEALATGTPVKVRELELPDFGPLAPDWLNDWLNNGHDPENCPGPPTAYIEDKYECFYCTEAWERAAGLWYRA